MASNGFDYYTARWHVAFTHARHELNVAADMAQCGFEAFVPVERYKRIKRGRKIALDRPLFPRYVFVKFDPDLADWGKIRDISGVVDLLRNEWNPVAVPVGIVEQFQKAQQLGLFDRTKAPLPFPPGSKIRLDENGPWSDFIGLVLRARSGDRVELLVNRIRVTVPLVRCAQI